MENNNKLIAQFMGNDTDEYGNDVYVPKEMMFNSKAKCMQGVFEFNECEFHTDWNWLMTVMEKIKQLNFTVNMQYLSCQGYIVSNKDYNAIYNHVEIASVSSIPNKYVSNPPTAQNPMFVSEFDCPKEALYNLVLRFIKWYNENK
jgi:hypothetical protein